MLVIKHNVSKKSGKSYFALCLRLGNYDLFLSFKDKDILEVLRYYNAPLNEVYSMGVGAEYVIPIN